MATRTITAMFDGRAEAEGAVEALVSQAGVDRGAVSISGGGSQPNDHEGFLSSLKNLFVPDEDRHAFAEGIAALQGRPRGSKFKKVAPLNGLDLKLERLLIDDALEFRALTQGAQFVEHRLHARAPTDKGGRRKAGCQAAPAVLEAAGWLGRPLLYG